MDIRDIYNYTENILGRKLTVLERRVVRSIQLARTMFPDAPMPKAAWSAPDKARYEQLAPIVDKYLEERANA